MLFVRVTRGRGGRCRVNGLHTTDKLDNFSFLNPPALSSTPPQAWVLAGEWRSSSGCVVSLGSCHRPLFATTQLPHIITVATEDATVTAINLHNMLQVPIAWDLCSLSPLAWDPCSLSPLVWDPCSLSPLA